MANEPDNQAEIDIGPLTREQLQGLARDQIEALRSTVQELSQYRDCEMECERVLKLLDLMTAPVVVQNGS
jgi:hypothetical protein